MLLDQITSLLQPVIKIKKHEWFKAGSMFLYSFFIFATLYILKPVRSSLYLDAHGAENLWWGYSLEGILLFFVTWIYVQFSKKFKDKNQFFTFTTLFLISNILVFWVCFKMNLKVSWFVLLFYGWVATYSVTVATQFWTMANDIFNPDEAKRLFGFIISGGSLGGVFGGWITSVFSTRFGTENLLLLTAVCLGIAVYISRSVWIHVGISLPAAVTDEPSLALKKERMSWIIHLFMKSRYLLLITALVLVAKMTSTIVDNLFNGIVENSIHEKNELTAFFGSFFAWLNAVSFILQLFVTSKVLRHLGIGISLLLLPIGLFIGGVTSILLPVLSIAIATRLYDGGLSYSINLLSKEILYLPIPSDVRYRVKPLIDMLFFRQSKFLAGMAIFLALNVFHLKVEQLGYVIAAIIPFWIWIALQVRHDYIEAIKQLLANRKKVERFSKEHSKRATDVLMNLFEEKAFQKLGGMLNQVSASVRKLSAAACLAFYGTGKDVSRVRKLVEEMVHYEAIGAKISEKSHHQELALPSEYEWLDKTFFEFLKGPADLGAFKSHDEIKKLLPKLSECLESTNGDSLIKRRAIALLKLIASQEACDILLHNLNGTLDNAIRFEIIQALNRIRSKKYDLKIEEAMVEKEIYYEITNHKSILSVIDFYRSNQRAALRQEDFLLATLNSIQEESFERIFRLLGLLYSTETIYIIYDRLLEEGSDETVRTHSFELLSNLIKPDLFRLLQPVIDLNRWKKERKEDSLHIIQRFLEGRDRWFSVCAIFLVAELKLHTLYSSIKEAASSKAPIVREAAEIAMKKI